MATKLWTVRSSAAPKTTHTFTGAIDSPSGHTAFVVITGSRDGGISAVRLNGVTATQRGSAFTFSDLEITVHEVRTSPTVDADLEIDMAPAGHVSAGIVGMTDPAAGTFLDSITHSGANTINPTVSPTGVSGGDLLGGMMFKRNSQTASVTYDGTGTAQRLTESNPDDNSALNVVSDEDVLTTLTWTIEQARDSTATGFRLLEAAAGPGTPVLGEVAAADDVQARLPVTTPGSGADTHEFHKSTTQGFTPAPGTLDGTYGASPTEVITSGALTADTDWYFKLVAVNASGTAESNEVTTKTAPAAPTGTTVNNATVSSLDVTVTGGGVATSTVMLNGRKQGGTWFNVLNAAPGYTWPFTDTGLEENQIYEYQASCLGNGWMSRFGPVGSGQTLSATQTMIMLRRRRCR